ncbi:MAG: hypothetical protein DRO15_05360 [Thermoprotei archaeon]|nr:MAG: hypothetical protein DRO15_05360 [Thermoprotei archaeon]
MSEECCDFIDNREELRRRHGEVLVAKITKHFLDRFLTRKARDYRKLDLMTIRSTILNILRDGKYYATTTSIIVFHPTYTIVACFDREHLVLKTVMRTKELNEKLRKLIDKGRKVLWRDVIILMPQRILQK